MDVFLQMHVLTLLRIQYVLFISHRSVRLHAEERVRSSRYIQKVDRKGCLLP